MTAMPVLDRRAVLGGIGFLCLSFRLVGDAAAQAECEAALRAKFDPAAGISRNTTLLSFATDSVGFAEEYRSNATSAATLLVAWGEPRRAAAFLLQLYEVSPDPPDRALAARLAAGAFVGGAVALPARAGRGLCAHALAIDQAAPVVPGRGGGLYQQRGQQSQD